MTLFTKHIFILFTLRKRSTREHTLLEHWQRLSLPRPKGLKQSLHERRRTFTVRCKTVHQSRSVIRTFRIKCSTETRTLKTFWISSELVWKNGPISSSRLSRITIDQAAFRSAGILLERRTPKFEVWITVGRNSLPISGKHFGRFFELSNSSIGASKSKIFKNI